jgi:hypothetical protein
MSSTVSDNPVTESVALCAWAEDGRVYIELHDERVLSFPAHKFSRLSSATPDQLASVRVRAEGSALRWDEIDEDISVEGILRGIFELD